MLCHPYLSWRKIRYGHDTNKVLLDVLYSTVNTKRVQLYLAKQFLQLNYREHNVLLTHLLINNNL